VVLGEVTTERLHTLASALAVHPRFPAGTNVELATVEAPDRVRVLIWERGVGPTEASGTGACAAAVAAIAYGGASREVDIHSPGGTQRVAWGEDGLYLTGWAEIVAEVQWLGAISGSSA
jgi:diaminopimelate epimerase